MAKETKKLQQIAKRNPDKLKGKDKAKAQRHVELDNVNEGEE